MSDIGKMLTQVIYAVIAIAAVIVFVLLVKQTKVEECSEIIRGSTLEALGKLRVCVNNCWSRHDFGRSTVNEDCYVINFTSTGSINKDTAEKILNNPAKVSFLVNIQPNVEIVLRVRYNSTGIVQIIPY
jgi:hypothetical protein